jgi:hypothetical protein
MFFIAINESLSAPLISQEIKHNLTSPVTEGKSLKNISGHLKPEVKVPNRTRARAIIHL